MSKVDEQDETDEDEYGCADEGDVVPQEHEEPIRDEECEDHKEEPSEYFRAPPPVE